MEGRDVIGLHRRALERTREVAAGIGDEQWTDPTPCAEWTVRDVADHVATECLWVPEIVAGRTVEEVGDRFDGDVLGADPRASFDRAAETAIGALDDLDDLQRTVHLSFGDVPAEVYAWQLFTDALVHGWDLAVATGQQGELDPDLCAAALEVNRAMITDDVRAAGIFGPEIAVPDDAGPCERLLGFLGRPTHWQRPGS